MLNLSVRFISHGTIFFSHNKTTSAGLSPAKTISRTALDFSEYENDTNFSTEGVKIHFSPSASQFLLGWDAQFLGVGHPQGAIANCLFITVGHV
jgi:hypothetical protein